MESSAIVEGFQRQYAFLLRLYSEEVHWVGSRIRMPRFTADQILKLFDATQAMISMNASAVISVQTPAWVVGDLQGNFHDLLRILLTIGDRPPPPIVFLGDYVDRGDFSLDVLLLLCTIRCARPDLVHLLRGNHEFAVTNAAYGFKEECEERYPGTAIWERANGLFTYFPIAAILGGTTCCVHGGLGPHVNSVDAIRAISLPVVGDGPDALLTEGLRSDPINVEGDQTRFAISARGRGYQFGRPALCEFLTASGCQAMIRAHECMKAGVAEFAGRRGVTVASKTAKGPPVS
jgi:diadenosine tetraphosphatase ApaH/serine/threonine PP2A family protein phosphatase